MIEENTLTNRTTFALSWRLLSTFTMFCLQFLVSVILARILPVEAFGLIGIAMIVIGFANMITEIGMSPAVIQIGSLTEAHIRVGFTLSLLSGLILSLGLFIGAPMVERYFQAENLANIVRVLSMTFVFRSLAATPSALLQRNLAFRKLFGVEFVSYCIGYVLLALPLSLLGFGVWALVWGAVFQSLLKFILLFRISSHSIKPSLSFTETKQMLSFGIGISLARLANFSARNGDYFVVGRWLGTEALGLYTRAYQIMTIPVSQFSSAVSTVLFPSYSEIQFDTERLRKAYIKSISITSLIVIPILCGLTISAPEIIIGVYGPKWVGSIRPFQILCFGGIGRYMYNLGDALARAKGAVYAQFIRHSIYALVIITTSFIGSQWGIEGVAGGVVISLMVMYLLMAQLVNSLLDIRWRVFFEAQVPGLVFGLIICLVLLPLTFGLRLAELPELVNLSIAILIASTSFVFFLIFLPSEWFGETRMFLIDRALLVVRLSTDSVRSKLISFKSIS